MSAWPREKVGRPIQPASFKSMASKPISTALSMKSRPHSAATRCARSAAHPVGTTVEVRELFFNTPARRKFLRSERTEFNHLDEVIKRIALSRFDVAVQLRHNGREVHALRAANSAAERAQGMH